MKKATLCILILLSFFSSDLFAQAANADENAIREIIEKFTSMWTTQDGVAIFQELSSDSHFMMLTGNSVLNKDDFVKQLTQILQNNPPVRHIHSIRKIIISGATAFEYGTMELVRQNGQTTKSEPLNVFFREDAGWKLIVTMPAVEIKKTFKE